nr:Asp-tRNA(Asn)/Glu-tRNA(Gln) amidotransferase subunit GatC [Alicyclobacillus sp. TC]
MKFLQITADTVRHVAKLARLAVSETEVERLTPELNDILHYAEQLQQLNLDDVVATSHSFQLVNALRADAVRPSLPREEALKNAPDSEQGQVRVPAVLEG